MRAVIKTVIHMSFRPNKRFKREYKRLFKKNPLTANMFLLLCQLANEKGEVVIKDERELTELMAVRFEDPEAWQL